MDQDTGKMQVGGSYSGPPIHTLTIFANPFIEDPPNRLGEGVQTVEPGEHFKQNGIPPPKKCGIAYSKNGVRKNDWTLRQYVNVM